MRDFDVVLKVCYVVWSLGICVLAGGSLYMSLCWHPTVLAVVAGLAATCISVANLAASVGLALSITKGLRMATRIAPLACVAGMAPVIVRALLPWEEPETGYGSPLAVLIGLFIYSVILLVVAVLPGVFGVYWLRARKGGMLAR